MSYGLTQGTGLQVLMVIASLEPLPPYKEWQSQLVGTPPWKHVEHEEVWRYEDGQFFWERSKDRDFRVRKALPEPLRDLANFLQSCPGVDAVTMLAFPVGL